MREQSYYRFIDVEANNLSDESIPLIVNCVGYAYMYHPFRTASVRNDFYLQYMDKGKLKTVIGGTETDFSPGQFVIHEAGKPYEYFLDGSEMGYYWVHFTGAYPRTLMKRLGLRFGEIYTSSENSANPGRIFSQLFREFMIKGRGFEDSCAALLVSLLTELARMTEHDGSDLSSGLKSRFMQSLSFIHNHYTEEIRIESLADMEHLSVSRYRDVFRKITGMAPIEYIISLRIQRACELLVSTDFTVTQIASLCGYGDVLYFIRLFHQKTGISPGAYRGK